MRLVIVDEAGTSADEPVQIVVGVIINPDWHIPVAEYSIHEVNNGLPKEFRKPGTVFHAKSLWNDREHKPIWSLSARVRHMKRMMSLPRRLGAALAVSVAIKDRASPVELAALAQHNATIPLQDWLHIRGFGACISAADAYIRDNGGLSEIGLVIAERVGHLQPKLEKLPMALRLPSALVLSPGMADPTGDERARGFTDQNELHQVTRLRSAVQFVDKLDEPLLQLADACAFGLRRFFEGAEFGDDFAAAIFGEGNVPDKNDFTGLFDAMTYTWGSFDPPPAHMAKAARTASRTPRPRRTRPNDLFEVTQLGIRHAWGLAAKWIRARPMQKPQ